MRTLERVLYCFAGVMLRNGIRGGAKLDLWLLRWRLNRR